MGVLVKVEEGTVLVARTVFHKDYTMSHKEKKSGYGWTYIDEDLTKEDFAPYWKSALKYKVADVVVHNKDLWYSILDDNNHEPGVTGWIRAVLVVPTWSADIEGVVSYPPGIVVYHKKKFWINAEEGEDNVHEPGVEGWREVYRLFDG
jgi:hypothetical protein